MGMIHPCTPPLYTADLTYTYLVFPTQITKSQHESPESFFDQGQIVRQEKQKLFLSRNFYKSCFYHVEYHIFFVDLFYYPNSLYL